MQRNQHPFIFFLFWVLAMSWLVGCAKPDSQEELPSTEGNTAFVSITSTPAKSVPIVTVTPTLEPASPSPTSISTTQTRTATTTEFVIPVIPTSTPTQTFTPTPLPKFQQVDAPLIPKDDPFWADLKSKGYEIIESTAVIGPKDYIYGAYLARDPESYDNLMGKSGPEACRLAVYRFSDGNGEFLQTFEAPGLIAYCQFNWVSLGEHWLEPFVDEATLSNRHSTLGISGNWSDINQNNLPEIGIYYNYCFNACINEGIPDVQFFEIESTSTVRNITDSLPGQLVPSIILASSYLPDLPVLDVQYETKWHQAESFWQFRWDGTNYVDNTQFHQQAYLEDARDNAAFIQGNFKDQSPIYYLEYIYEILLSLEKAGLSETGYELFMDLTKPENWEAAAESDIELLKWVRSEVENDFVNNRNFVFRLINCDIDPTLGICP